VCDAPRLTVELLDGRELPATTYGIDTLTDLAIVKVDAADLPAAPVGDSSRLKAGQISIAIGSSMGTFTNSVTSGVISAVGRDITVTDLCGTGRERSLHGLIQTDAAINPGNSGGALVDWEGKVVGVNTALAEGGQGIGFAIPINIAKPIMDQAVASRPLTRPYVGVRYEPVTPALAERQGLAVDHGVLVVGVDGEPAEDAGVAVGDVITAIDGQRIDVRHTLDEILTRARPEQTVVLTVLRDSDTLRLPLVLGTRPAEVV
jgi:S1-C subfamily serine protease